MMRSRSCAGSKSATSSTTACHITDDAMVAAAPLSARYITERFFPDKAIDLIDEASARRKIQVENKPPTLDTTESDIVRLEIEREALKKKRTPPRATA